MSILHTYTLIGITLYTLKHGVFSNYTESPFRVGRGCWRCWGGSEYFTQTKFKNSILYIYRYTPSPNVHFNPDDRKISRIDISYKGFVHDQLHFVVFFSSFLFFARKLEFAYTTGSFHGRRPFRLWEFIAVNRSALVVYPNAMYTRDGITCKTVVDLDIYIYIYM